MERDIARLRKRALVELWANVAAFVVVLLVLMVVTW